MRQREKTIVFSLFYFPILIVFNPFLFMHYLYIILFINVINIYFFFLNVIQVIYQTSDLTSMNELIFRVRYFSKLDKPVH